ncbi:hypothetical protein KHA96_04570 [Bacillus sp. FJAT-49711]|uniref:hypothetical protein n=1 Tax=Bacillus sp. FJAT-49711 TaxID=2833585 RepID=UPI001BCA4EBA|nr:hypothetical protein [Bacillus sp. FJAT-49711]MBS4217587.1 hypothetical protein [Bacillus sp. FJAT-49711]
MKTKFYAILIMSFVLFIAGAIGHEGLHSKATQQEISDILVHPQKNNSELNKNLVLKDSVTVKVETVSSVKGIESETTVEKTTPEDVASVNDDESLLPKEVTIDGTIFINIMNEEKFSDLSQLARKYNAGLYAIPESDVFAIVKEDNPIFFMSTGAKSALKDYSDLLSESLAFSGFENLEEVRNNLNSVLETGKEVNIVDGYEGYSIFQEDEWVYVSW